jgi:hypothetical protein
VENVFSFDVLHRRKEDFLLVLGGYDRFVEVVALDEENRPLPGEEKEADSLFLNNRIGS